MKILAIGCTDGSLSLTGLSDEANIDAQVSKWKNIRPGEYVSHREIDEAVLPANKHYRDAWRLDGAAVYIDMDAAREIHRDALRVLRAPLMAAQDIKFMRAVEEGNQPLQAEIARNKQALRDVTRHPDIDAATTPDELCVAIPEILTGSQS